MLIPIIILAAFLRLTNLASLPYMFDGDETYFGYYSYSLANFGSDEFGRPLPLYFSSIGDFKYPLYAYLGTVWIRLFGLTEFSTRFTSAVAGIIAVAIMAVIVGLLTRRKSIVYYSALFLSVSPWHLWMSRRALEANLGLTFILLGVAVFLKKWWLLAVLFSGLAIFSYPSSRIFIIILAAIGFGYFLYRQNRAAFLTSLTVLVIGLAAFVSPESRARGTDITVWNSGNLASVKKLVNQDLHADGLAAQNIPVFFNRLLHNQFFYLTKDVADKALSHFDPSYLLIRGEQRDRYSIPRMGLLSYVEAFAVFLGLFYLYRHNSRWWLIAVVWWFLSAVSPAITTEAVHSVRYAIAVVAVTFLAGWGLVSLNPKVRYLVLFLLALNTVYFWHQYSVQKTFLNPWYPEAEMHRLPELVSLHMDRYSAVSLPGDAYIYFLFDYRLSPADFTSQAQIDAGRFNWDRVNQLGKIVFKMSSVCPKIGKLKTLYLCVGGDIPQNARVVELVRYRDGLPAYSLIEFFPISQVLGEPLPDSLHRMVESDFRFNPDGLLPDDYPGLWL